jgi:PAS domain S-box-containing protein
MLLHSAVASGENPLIDIWDTLLSMIIDEEQTQADDSELLISDPQESEPRASEPQAQEKIHPAPALSGPSERSRLTIESALDYAIFTTDLERGVSSWNSGAQALFGYTEAEILGQCADILFVPEDRERGAPQWEAETAKTKGRAENERWHSRKDGSRFYGSGLMMPLRNDAEATDAGATDAGAIIGFVKIMRDLTEQKRVQETKFFLASIVESSQDSMITVNFDGIITSWNQAAEKLYGYAAQEAIGKPLTMLTLPQDLREVLSNIERIKHSQKVETFDTVRVHKGGRQMHLEVVLSPVKNDHGQVIGVSTVARDVTKRIRAEQALRESEARLQQAMSIETVGVLFFDLEGTFTDANDAFLQMSGFTREQVERDRINTRQMTLPEWMRRTRQALEELKVTGRLSPYEKELVRADGSRWWGLFAGTRLSETEAVEFVLDITERKRAEAERADLLEREHAARVEAEAANRAKDEFLATVSHELRTPLTALIGWVGLLRRGNLDAATSAHALKVIERSANTEAQIVEDVLEASRIIHGKLELDMTPLDLREVAEAAVEILRPVAEAKALQLSLQVAPEPCVVAGDKHRLQQIVSNLLSNAIKFTPSHGSIEVYLEGFTSHAEIRVRDTGQGINSGFLPDIFERFRQADSSATRAHGGLGLGLAIVRHLVEALGGTVQAQSPGLGQGTTFTVRLPLLVERTASSLRTEMAPTQRTTDLSAATGEASDDSSPTLRGLRVLVVDDDGDAREMIATMLQGSGAVVTSAASVAEAMKAIEETRPDVLLSDIGMPEEDGYTLMRKLRARESERGEPPIPAAALTSYAGPEDRARALASGYQLYVPKPVNPDDLVAAVASLISISR